MAEDSVEVARFEKNDREEVRVSIDNFHGKTLVNIRVFFRSAEGEWRPGKQGLALSTAQYRHLASALVEVGEALALRGLIQTD